MRIAFLADASLPHTVRWANYFVQQGHECLLLSLEPGEGYDCRTVWLAPHNTLPRFLRYTLEIRAVRRHLATFQPDLINAHFLPNYGLMAAHLRSHPMVLTVLGSDILTVPRNSPLHRWRTRWVLQQCDAVTSDAQMLSEAVRAFGFATNTILTVPLGIELERFPWPPQRPAPSATHPCVVLSSRRLDPIYDVGTLLMAWQQLSEPPVPVQLRVAGKGSEEDQLRKLLPQGAAEFLGWLTMPELDEALRGAHIYVSTSLSDSTSVSLLEAMAAGCFPIVSDIPGNREWVEDGKNGMLFPVGDTAALARALESAANNPALRQTAGDINRDIVQARASWADNMGEVGALFHGLSQPRRP